MLPAPAGNSAFELVDGAGTDDDGVEAEFLGQLLLPLFAEVWWAEHAESFDLTAIGHFTGDEQGFDGFADPDIVGDQHPYGVEPQGHEQGDELVGAWANGDAPERAERGGSFAECETRRLPEQVCPSKVRDIVWGRWGELGGADAFFWKRVTEEIGEAFVDRNHFVGGAG